MTTNEGRKKLYDLGLIKAAVIHPEMLEKLDKTIDELSNEIGNLYFILNDYTDSKSIVCFWKKDIGYTSWTGGRK